MAEPTPAAREARDYSKLPAKTANEMGSCFARPGRFSVGTRGRVPYFVGNEMGERMRERLLVM